MLAQALRRIGTWFAVHALVVGVGYGTGWLYRERRAAEVTGNVAHALRLRASGDEAGAAALLADQLPAMARLTRMKPRDPVRRLERALALSVPGPERDLAAAERELRLARGWMDTDDPVQRDLLREIERWRQRP